MNPVITVVMSVYNGERFLGEAIESILGQSYAELEFIILDDGSTDASARISTSFGDPRIRVVRHNRNLGLAASLNVGFSLAAGRYIARMDADDISLPTRLAHQVAFMDAHPHVGVCGSWIEVRGEGIQQVWEYPTDSDSIHARLLFDCALAHPTVMLNRVTMQKARLFYDSSYPCAQDYDLWTRAAPCVPLANIPEVLLIRRLHPAQAGQHRAETQRIWARKIRERQLERLGLSPTVTQGRMHEAISTWSWPPTDSFVMEAELWLQLLCRKNKEKRIYPEPAFARVVGERWKAICQSVEPTLGRRFWMSSLSVAVDLGWKQNLMGRVRRRLALMAT
ncbi:MAG: glycosyltransferase [Nitrospiraceae bacterium]